MRRGNGESFTARNTIVCNVHVIYSGRWWARLIAREEYSRSAFKMLT